MKLKQDTTISHYRIVSKIGKGGMGEVYLAQDTKLNRKVAIKFLNEEFGKDAEKLNRFIQEAQATSALNHPNILTVHGIDSFEDTHYIATEFIEGETLREVISQKESVPLNQILKIGIQTAEALSASHQAGIAHRDIKPENIMIRKDGYVKVLDFGLAKLTEKNKSEDDISLEGETKALVKTNPGVVMGTVSYMSPEQARGKETDERTDIWSLGVVLYEMLAGKVPFTGETINHTIVAILETEPKLLENVPDELQRIVRKTLTKEKDNRYQTARDLVIDLKNLRRELDLQGELERSIMPNKDTEIESENKTAVYNAKSVEETKAENAGLETKDEQRVTNSSSLEYAVTQAKSHKLATAVIGILLLGVISAIAYFAFLSGGNQINSIAVMPFVNESGDEDIEYLSDGMTETLISSLTKIPNLSVMARSSVFYYKGKNTNPRQIGEELNVEAILLGRVTQRGDDLKISLELVDTKTLAAIWSETYDRKMSDLVSLQSEIARDVSDKLRLKLSTAAQEKVAKTDTKNSEAQQLYLKGRFYWNKRTNKDFERAEDYFQQAIEKDPTYALAYSGLSDTYFLMPQYGSFRPKEYHPKAKQAVLKALELDPDLAEAYASLGGLLTLQYDFDGGDRALKKAIELNPNYATAHQWYAENLAYQGKTEEALKEIEIALKLDPFSRIINHVRAFIFESADRYDEAIEQGEKTIELFPKFTTARSNLSRHYAAKGNYDKAIEHRLIIAKDRNIEAETIQTLKTAYEKAGWKGHWTMVIEMLLSNQKKKLEKDKTAYIKYGYLAHSYATISNKEKTLEYLNKAYEQGEPALLDIRNVYYFDFLRDDPRFKELIKKVGFPE